MTDSNSLKNPQVSISKEVNSLELKEEGNLTFVAEYGENVLPTYQEASGAPVESISPFGHEVTSLSAVFLNIGQMIGTGVFSTPASILQNVGSVGLSLIFWVLGFLIGSAQLAVYMELASYFPNRSGAEVVYLEQAYPRPKYLLPTAFMVQSVLLSFSSSNTIVMAEYLFAMGGYTPSDWEKKGLAVGCMTVITLLVSFNTKYSLKISDAVGVLKIIILTFISITGLVVLGGHTRVANPTANFTNAFSGTNDASGYGLANALVKVNFAYSGYTNAFNVVNEVKNPIKTLKKIAPISLLVVTTLYLLCNIAYFAAVSKADLMTSNQLAAALFFKAVFGNNVSVKALNFLVALSAMGNIVSVIIGSSRIIRECGRQGVMPFPRIWGSSRPFGTPLAAYLLKWALTILMTLAPPAGDAFNFIVDLQSYPANVFYFLTTFGVILIRRRRAKMGIARAEFRVWNVAIIFSLAINVFLLVMPWYPPTGGADGGDVSFWYATYCAVGLGILGICVLYYFLWIHILPYFGHYQIRQELVVLDDETSKVNRLVKVPTAELEEWNATHDVIGQKIEEAPRPRHTFQHGNDMGLTNEKPSSV